MKLVINCLILLILVIASKGAKTKQNPKCNESTRQRIDKQFVSVVPSLNGVKLPENEKQLQKYCTSATIAMDSATSYVKSCGGTFGPLISRMVSTEFAKEFDSVCKAKDSRRVKDVLGIGKCVNSVNRKLEKCANYMIDSVMALKNVAIENRMNTACCQGHKFMSCAMRTLSKSKRCEKSVLDMIEREVSKALGVGDICGPYFGDTNRCSKLLAKLPKKDNSYIRPKSVFIPAITLMDSYRNMKCTTQTEQRMDTTLAQLITIGTPEQIPETSVQLKQWCTKAIQTMPYFYGYIESCVSDFGKFLAKVMSGAVVTNFTPYCGPGATNLLDSQSPDIQEYVKAAKCGNKAEDKLKVCFDKFNEKVLAISEAPEMSRMRMACCNAYEFRTCIYNGTTTTKGCSVETVEWAERQVMQSAEGAINLVCVDHWGGPKCDALMRQLPKLDKTKYIPPKSPFFPMIKLMDSFPEVELQK